MIEEMPDEAPAPRIASPRGRTRAHVTTWVSPAGGANAGGDWCDAVPLSEQLWAFTIGDVCGHGEAVAGTMEMLRRAVLSALRETAVPSEVLAQANEIAYGTAGGVLVTAIVALLDSRRRTITFANAGHPPPLLTTGVDQAFLFQPPADLLLGAFPRYRAADYVVALPHDAQVVMYTDGITEHDRDPIAGESELIAAARRAYALPDGNQARTIAQEMLERERGHDDAAALVFRLAPASRRDVRS